ncbi:hypothetical protein [Saccharicrinis aurantiacus]|uniref:hypothetical protein n=1 Tax=Saccharicrinis aurantiacus TaxID=1849719 RepID=UPI00094FF495|nr:hypothetical protein [Saccharicrinis aurantiacus]
MNFRIKLVIIIAFQTFMTLNIHAQTNLSKRIHVIRERSFLGSGNKMDVQVNGESVFKLKNGWHLIIDLYNKNQIDFQIVYPVMQRFKTEIVNLLDEKETEVYLLVSYKGAGENFRIQMERITSSYGQEFLENSKRYAKRTEIVEM